MSKRLLTAALAAATCATGCVERVAPAAPTPAAQKVSASDSATDTAARMDTRVPVPLLPMMAEHQKAQMRGHLGAVQEIVAALSKNDFVGVEEATKKIGYSDSMAKMCTHMGAGAPGFTPTAIEFHRTADTIGAAAKKKNRAAVLDALNATLNTCVGCHATYKQQIVDEATWAKLTSTSPPSGDHAACPMMEH
jgi:hypothetical protein